jgi:hypothetical protein
MQCMCVYTRAPCVRMCASMAGHRCVRCVRAHMHVCTCIRIHIRRRNGRKRSTPATLSTLSRSSKTNTSTPGHSLIWAMHMPCLALYMFRVFFLPRQTDISAPPPPSVREGGRFSCDLFLELTQPRNAKRSIGLTPLVWDVMCLQMLLEQSNKQTMQVSQSNQGSAKGQLKDLGLDAFKGFGHDQLANSNGQYTMPDLGLDATADCCSGHSQIDPAVAPVAPFEPLVAIEIPSPVVATPPPKTKSGSPTSASPVDSRLDGSARAIISKHLEYRNR